MSQVFDTSITDTLPITGSARLMLDVGAPRVAARAEQVKDAFRELRKASPGEILHRLAGIPGLEALAVLGRLPQQQRERVIRELPLEDSDRAKLVDLAQAIGEPEDTNSWAAALSTMYPDSTGGDQQAGIQPAGDQQAEPVDDEPLSHLELEELAATVATWSPPDRARRALFTLLPPCVQHGSPFPLEFWTRAARRLRDSWTPDEGSYVILLARMIHRLGDPETALDLLQAAKGKVTQPAQSTAIASSTADILAARGELDEALRIRREEELPVYERLGAVRERAITWSQIAHVLAARGELDEALRIYREESLPVYERLGDVRSILVGRGNIAMLLLQRGAPGDCDEAGRLLRLALEAAERLRLPETDQIRQILTDAGFSDQA